MDSVVGIVVGIVVGTVVGTVVDSVVTVVDSVTIVGVGGGGVKVVGVLDVVYSVVYSVTYSVGSVGTVNGISVVGTVVVTWVGLCFVGEVCGFVG